MGTERGGVKVGSSWPGREGLGCQIECWSIYLPVD
jgi:hypothetical protein